MSGGRPTLAAVAVVAVALVATFLVISLLAGPDEDGVDVVTSEGATPDPSDAVGPVPSATEESAAPSDPAPTADAEPTPGADGDEPAGPGQVIRYVSAQGAGSADGSSTGQPAPIQTIGELIAAHGPGLEVRIIGSDPVVLDSSIPISSGGSQEAPVTIRGWPPSDRGVELVGNRVTPYAAGGEPGREVFRLQPGADHLRFSGLRFSNVGVAFRVTGDVTDVSVRDVTASNVRRFFDTNASQDNETASVSGLRLQDVTVAGFSKNVIRVRYDSSDVLIQDVSGDSERQDGDDFAVGVQLAGTAHNIVLRRVRMANSNDSTGDYWNGDGFSVERGVRGVQFIDTLASGNTDGGYDIKGTEIVMRSVRAVDNKRNYRFWGQIDIRDCEGTDPLRRGGTGTQAQVHLAFGAAVTMQDCRFIDDDGSTIVFDLDGPQATLQLDNVSVVRAEAAQLSTVEPGNTFEPGSLSEQFATGG